MDDVTAWIVEQQRVAQESALRNRGIDPDDIEQRCVRCGSVEPPFSYRFGRIDEPVCRDRRTCGERKAA